MGKWVDKRLEKIRRDKKKLAEEYSTDESKIVFIGDNKYIVVLLDGTEVRI